MQEIRNAAKNDAEALQKLGVTLSQLEEYEKAEAVLAEAFAADESNLDPLLQIAQIRSATGDNRGALEALQTTISLQPKDPKFLAALLNVVAGLNRLPDLTEAITSAVGGILEELSQDDRQAAFELPLSDALLKFGDDAMRLVLYDVGARDALSDQRWTSLPSANIEIHGFEPDPPECERLEKLAHSMGYRFFYHPIALWSNTTSIEFEFNEADGGGSVLPQNRTVTDRWKFVNATEARPSSEVFYPIRTEKMEARSLNDWLSESEAPLPDFIKLNVQGGEIEILDGSQEAVENAVGVLLEVGFVDSYHDRPFFSDVDVYLRDRGFEFFDFISHHYVGRASSKVTARHLQSVDPRLGSERSAWGQLIEAHALYFRDPVADIDRFTVPDRLAKVAILAETFGQIDFAYEVAETLLARFPEYAANLRDELAASIQKYVTL